MQAVEWNSKSTKLEFIRLDIPDNPKPNNVIIKIAYCGICGSDFHMMTGTFPCAEKVILGHEFTGTIVSIGSDVNSLQIGERVVVVPNPYCGKCSYCVQGLSNLCDADFTDCLGCFKNGGWAEFCEVPAFSSFKLPDDLPLKYAVFTEPTACVIRGFMRLGKVSPNVKILVMGTGIAGVLFAIMFHHHGCRDITIMGRSPERMKIVDKMKLGKKVCTLTEIDGEMAGCQPVLDGYSIIVDTTGSTECIQKAVEYLRKGGIFNIYGVCPVESEIKLSPGKLLMKEATLTTSYVGVPSFQDAIDFINAKKETYFNHDFLHVKEFALSHYKEAVESLKSGQAVKAIFKIDGE